MGYLLSLLADQLFDIYMNYASPALAWEALNRKYGEMDAGRELYINELYHDFKMADTNSVVVQTHEIQLLVGNSSVLVSFCLTSLWWGGIIAKLPSILEELCHYTQT